MNMAHQWIVSQIGSRQHYAVPRGFAAMGQLKRFYTDAWCPSALRRWLLRGNAQMRAFATRWHADIPAACAVSYNFRAIRDAIHYSRLGPAATRQQMHVEYLRVGQQFDRSVARHLRRPGRVEPGRDAFFGFNTGCLETIRLLRERGVVTVLDQIDPAKAEEDIILAEMEKWPGWQQVQGRVSHAFWDRLAAEWEAADLIAVNSNWSRTALIRQGVPAEKLLVVAQAFEPDVGPIPMPRRDRRPMVVLWLGAVILRKGIQYLIEAARMLADQNLKFVVVGPIGISKLALDTAPRNMSFLGRVTSDQTDEIYRQADVFVLPTLSDGFAATQLEAMSRGLPVITTPNCGEVVTQGKDGLIVPVADAKSLANAIVLLDRDRNLLAEMSHNAFIRSTQFLLPNQARQVEAAVCQLELEGKIWR